MVFESSRPLSDVAREASLGAEILRVWVNRHKQTNPDERTVLYQPDRAELERRNTMDNVVEEVRINLALDRILELANVAQS